MCLECIVWHRWVILNLLSQWRVALRPEVVRMARTKMTAQRHGCTAHLCDSEMSSGGSFSMHILLSAVFVSDYIRICLYIYVHSKNCCWMGGRSNIRCVYIYIHILHIFLHIPLPSMPLLISCPLHRSGSLLATKAEKNWTPKQDVSRQRSPGSRDLGRILFMCCGFCAQNPINTSRNGNKTIWKFV